MSCHTVVLIVCLNSSRVCVSVSESFDLLYQDCDELADWIAEKMLAARDDTYRDAKNAHSKWMRHQVCIH